MDQKQAIALVRQYKEAIEGLFDNPNVYLYGSYSKISFCCTTVVSRKQRHGFQAERKK